MSYLRYLCLLTYWVSNTYCVVSLSGFSCILLPVSLDCHCFMALRYCLAFISYYFFPVKNDCKYSLTLRLPGAKQVYFTHTIYVHVVKIYNLFLRALETGRKANI